MNWNGILSEAARRSKCIVQHGTQMRSSEVTAEATKAFASGVLGEINLAKAWGVEPRSSLTAVSDTDPPGHLD